MTYFLDFDRTLFDTEAFKRMLRDRLCSGAPASNQELVERIHAACLSGEVTFAPGELASFIYPDARTFLESEQAGMAVITYGNPELQRMKVESALPEFRGDVHYTGDSRKAAYLAHLGGAYERAVAVDDAPIELAAWTETFPAFSIYEIRRDDMSGDGRWPVIHSLLELPETLPRAF